MRIQDHRQPVLRDLGRLLGVALMMASIAVLAAAANALAKGIR